MDRHACYDREFPDTVEVQDGWIEVGIHGHAAVESCEGSEISPQTVRVPRMVRIPFKMSRACHQWEPPYGAVVKGVMDGAGCAGCMWTPDELPDEVFEPEIEVSINHTTKSAITGIKGNGYMFVIPCEPIEILQIFYREKRPDGTFTPWRRGLIDAPAGSLIKCGDTVRFREAR